jgi:hypothetical protein
LNFIIQVVPNLVKEQCVLRGWPLEWVADEVMTLQLAVVDKKSRSQLLPLVSQSQSQSQSQAQLQPGSGSGMRVGAGVSVGDVRVRVEASEQKADEPLSLSGSVAEVSVRVVSEPLLDHQFAIGVKVAAAGQHQLRVWVRDVEVPGSPFNIDVKDHQVGITLAILFSQLFKIFVSFLFCLVDCFI